MKKLIYIALIIFSVTNASGQELKKEYQKFIQTFIDNVKGDKKEEIAKIISYPLKRENPIPSIKNKAEFIKRYSEVFDADLKKEITSSKPDKDWSEVGWRGIMLNNGTIWIDTDGKLKTINYQSAYEKELKAKLIASQKKNLHSSIANFKKPLYVLETAKFRIRIDDLGNENYRYASWSIKKGMNEKPDLIISNGKWSAEGSGGNSKFEFKSGGYLYECYIIVLGTSDSPPATLTIYENNKEILSQNAKIVPR
ncbi:hypothetical protein IRZ71_03270 [Flavobacterium sp. ANB]|uniref:hypothetical protein n=1 Tax=unclassified Flavobacterium TaxID=196869 RepID=UPI0012B765C5|nr:MULTISPECIES: hypothetical protein [unclassified Flavobacterium]MBF4515341.1 hypothetical protein [Flavobacterium sp. ANB]MTD70253.1 hypothetical protein [Flavobacterium sp. LC2016-13]